MYEVIAEQIFHATAQIYFLVMMANQIQAVFNFRNNGYYTIMSSMQFFSFKGCEKSVSNKSEFYQCLLIFLQPLNSIVYPFRPFSEQWFTACEFDRFYGHRFIWFCVYQQHILFLICLSKAIRQWAATIIYRAWLIIDVLHTVQVSESYILYLIRDILSVYYLSSTYMYYWLFVFRFFR